MRKYLYLVMVCSLLVTCRHPENEPENIVASGTAGVLKWKITENGTLTISGKGEMSFDRSTYAPWSRYTGYITAVIIENGVTSIKSTAFEGCYKLTSITIPNSIIHIGFGAFQHCQSLTSITIPNSVKTIEGAAFASCSGLTSVTIPNSVTSIEDQVFMGCSGLMSINVVVANSAYSSDDGVLFNKIKTTLIQYPAGKTGVYTIPNSVKTIGHSAFFWCELTSVTIPISVETIGILAFLGCSNLTELIIPSSVTSIGISTFAGCSGLKEIINQGFSPQTIDNSTFKDVDKTATTLRVLAVSVNAYKAANGWKDFVNIVAIE